MKMDYIKHAVETIKKGAEEAADKAASAYRKSELRKELKEMYEALGKIRYSEIKNNNLSEEETLKLTSEIDRILREMSDIKGEVGKVCESCAEAVPSDCRYCPYCGAKLY